MLALDSRPSAFTRTVINTALHDAVRSIASRCDGAHTLDGVGFNGHDALFGARVAWHTTPDTWSDEMSSEVHRMLRTYKVQLGKYGVEYDALPEPFVLADSTVHAARDEARAAERKSKRGIKVYFDGVTFAVKGRGTYDVKDTIKSFGARWDGEAKAWAFDLDQASAVLALVQAVDWLGIDESAETALGGVEAAKPEVTSVKVAKVIKHKVALVWKNVTDADFNMLLAEVRDLPGREYLSSKKANVVDLTREVLDFVTRHQFTGADEVETALLTYEEQERERLERESAAEQASRAAETDREVALSEHLYAYQRAGVAYVLDHADGRAIIGDEMGLGKTRQAIAVLEDREAYPAVIVAPPHLVRTWKGEYDKVNPDRVVRILKGTSPDPSMVEGADVLIIGYSVLKPWVEYRIGDPVEGEVLLQPKAVVFDESHYAKNHASQRTKAALALAGRVREEGLRLCLTGTPVLNRADEILSQIELIGRWKDFGSKAEFLREYQYAGARKLEMLNARMRRVCYVRRLKSEVLADLPSKSRFSDYVEDLDSDIVEEYYEAAADILNYLREFAGKEKVTMAERAATLVKLNVLRQIAGRAKIAPAIEWAKEFVEGTERSLVVFAAHREVQNAIYDGLVEAGISVARIHGDDSDTKVEDEKARFQNGEARVIVCSLKKGGTGHTLTAASDVLIVEQDWTPANLNQAEDRVHRIGQDEAVTATHLVADLPIDRKLRAVVEAKQAICDAVAQGAVGLDDATDSAVVSAVIDALLADAPQASAAPAA